MKKQKKQVLGLWQLERNSLGQTGWKATIQVQELWDILYPVFQRSDPEKSVYLVREVGFGAADFQDAL